MERGNFLRRRKKSCLSAQRKIVDPWETRKDVDKSSHLDP